MGQKATFPTLRGDAGFTPNSDHLLRRHEVTRCAISAHHDRSEGTSLLRAYGQRTSGPFAMLAAISERLSFRLLIAKL